MYNPYNNFNPYTNFYQNNMQQPTKQEIVRVTGQEGANAYAIAPNSSILLLDENKPIVYLKTTDGAGYPTITAYSIVAYKPEPIADISTLEKRIERLEERIYESNNTGTDRSNENVTSNENS